MQWNKKSLLKVIEKVPPKMVKKIIELSDGLIQPTLKRKQGKQIGQENK